MGVGQQFSSSRVLVGVILAALAVTGLILAIDWESAAPVEAPSIASAGEALSEVELGAPESSPDARTASPLEAEPEPIAALDAVQLLEAEPADRVPRFSPLVTVVVFDDHSMPLAGARVELTAAPIDVMSMGWGERLYSRRGVTDGAGEVIFRVEPNEVSALARDIDVGIYVRANRFATNWDSRICDLQEDLHFEISLERTNTMGGIVLSEEGNPVEDALVAAVDIDGKVFDWTDSHEGGRFFLERDESVVPLAIVGYHASFGWGRLPVGFVRENAHDDLGEVRLTSEASLEGVIESASGKRYADTRLFVERVRQPRGGAKPPRSPTRRWIQGGERWRMPGILNHTGLSASRASTDSEGRFSVRGLLPGRYWISLEDWNERGGSSLRFPERGRGLGPFRTGGFQRVVVDAYQIRVSVVDQAGRALPQAHLSVFSEETSQWGTIGSASECYSVSPGEVLVIASVLDDLVSGETTVEVSEPGRTYDVEVVLDLSAVIDCTGSISVSLEQFECTARDSFEARLASKASREYSEEFNSHTIEALTGAVKIVPDLRPGTYAFDMVSMDGRHFDSTESIRVECEQVSTVEFVPACGGRLQVTIRSVSETLSASDFGAHVHRTDENGIPINWSSEYIAPSSQSDLELAGESALEWPGDYFVQLFRRDDNEGGVSIAEQHVRVEAHATASVVFEVD